MAGLGVGSLVQSGFDLHWLAGSEIAQVGLILLAVPFVLQLIASVLSFMARDGATGSTMGVLATSWLAIGVVYLSSRASDRSGALGLMLLASAGVLVLLSISVAAAKPLPGAVFVLESVRFALAGVYELTGGAWGQAAGIAGLLVVTGAAYCALAFELEGQHHRAVLPTFRRGRGRAALSGAPAAALDDFLHDAGVRQMT
jgi:succinate-acetate transporter protein